MDTFALKNAIIEYKRQKRDAGYDTECDTEADELNYAFMVMIIEKMDEMNKNIIRLTDVI